ncbi:MAG: hypothetical protein PHC65_07250 [Methanobacteriaceae archaeon]|nr:hypothetical protein [Methanobacteriaceae archaeon]MDD4438920.1 hypothetical protein [Tissierellia bacterium]
MIDVEKRIQEINNAVSDNKLFLEYGLLSLAFFELKEYIDLVCEINRSRDNVKKTVQRVAFIPLYKKVFLAQGKKLNAILSNIKDKTIDIFPIPTEQEMKNSPLETLRYDDSISAIDNFFVFAEHRIKRALNLNNEELYILNHYPSVFYNNKNSYIGGDFGYRYENELIIYKNVHAATDGMHHFATYTNDNNSLADQRALLNILAFLNGRPNFEFTKNPRFNQKLDDLYQRFDLLDCIRLRDSNYLKADTEKSINLELPIIKNKNYYNLIIFEDMTHEGILDLYHASLKQFEPLPRCIFLYRVFEYAASCHYKPTFQPTEYKVEDAIEYYLAEALLYNPNPLYYIRFSNRKVIINNFFTVLKNEARKILVEWDNNPFLSNKTRGEIIYLTGRNFTAHGGNGERNMQYDYDKNYLHINNINIMLELIARYVIELLNPNIRKIVTPKTQYYLQKYNYHIEDRLN